MSKPARLPLPDSVVSHHGRILFGPMNEWRSKKQIPPVLLLTGVPGIGKSSMSHYLGQWILCENNGINEAESQDSLFGGAPAEISERREPGPCRQCASCQKAEHGTWIDFTEIEAEEETLKIDQFRKLKSTMGFGGHEGKHRIIHIPNADQMTIQAANSVLKLLEEPPQGWVFLLTATDPSLLLPTIVSRCQTIRLKPFPVKTLEELLTPVISDPKKRSICAELAQGSWGKALAWTEEETWERRKIILDFLRDPKANLTALVDWATADPQNMDRMIDQMESLISDLIRWSLESASPESHRWLNADAGTILAARARDALRGDLNRTRQTWLERAERLARARHDLQAPLNRKLMVQDLLLPWLLVY